MLEMTKQKLIELANYYINNDISLEELAHLNNTSKKTIIRYFSGNASVYLPKELQEMVDAKKSKNWLDSKATYGNQGKISISKEELVKIAECLIENNYTLREIATTKNVSPTTIYNLLNEENIGKELYIKVQSVYRENKENAFNEVNKKK